MKKKPFSLKLPVIIACAAVMTYGLFHSIKTPQYFHDRTVKLFNGRMGCSGEQIRAPSGTDYILTAAHCAKIAKDGMMPVITEDGRHLERRVIAEDPYSDLLLIEGIPGLRGLDIAPHSDGTEHVRTFTHGRLLPTYETEGQLISDQHVEVLLGMISNDEDAAACSGPKYEIVHADPPFDSITGCFLNVEETVTNAMIVPGSSGGMVVNDSGDLVGVVSAGDGVFGLLVRLHDIHKFVGNY